MNKFTEKEVREALERNFEGYSLYEGSREEVIKRLKRAGLIEGNMYTVILDGVETGFKYTFLDEGCDISMTDEYEDVYNFMENELEALPEWALPLVEEVKRC